MPLQSIDNPEHIRAVVDSVFTADAYDWSRAISVWQAIQQLRNEMFEWMSTLQEQHPVLFYVGLIVSIAILAAILTHWAILVRRALRYKEPVPDRVQSLKGPVHDARYYRRRANEKASHGDIKGAMADRFIALLLELDVRHAVRFDPAKTPAEYVREAALSEDGSQLFSTLVTTLYRHLFGGIPCQSDDWRRFERMAEDLPAHAKA